LLAGKIRARFVGAAVMGFVVGATRADRLSLFPGAAVANDITLLPVMWVVLPVWLIATGQPKTHVPGAASNLGAQLETSRV
jgi:hypothetical protein